LSRDRTLGGLLLAGEIIGIILYAYLLYAHPLILLQITAFLTVAAALSILAWIGYTLATAPPIEPLLSEPRSSPAPTPSPLKPENKPTPS